MSVKSTILCNDGKFNFHLWEFCDDGEYFLDVGTYICIPINEYEVYELIKCLKEGNLKFASHADSVLKRVEKKIRYSEVEEEIFNV